MGKIILGIEASYAENSPLAYYIDDTAGTEWAVFLHAAFVNSEMFAKQFEYFKGKYNVLAIDILGHGNSIGTNKSDSIENMSDWINSILVERNIHAAHFVGISLGSVFIQDFADKYEEKVLSLACFGGYDINNFDAKAQRENSKGQMKMVLKALFSIKSFAKANKKISAYTAEAQDEFYRMNIEFPKKSLIYLSKLNRLVNRYPNKTRSCPLLIGCGEHDIPLEIKLVREWAAAANCESVIIQGAGHCVNMDKPQEFNSILEDFWSNVANGKN